MSVDKFGQTFRNISEMTGTKYRLLRLQPRVPMDGDGNFNFLHKKLRQISTPTDLTDAANKEYVDNKINIVIREEYNKMNNELKEYVKKAVGDVNEHIKNNVHLNYDNLSQMIKATHNNIKKNIDDMMANIEKQLDQLKTTIDQLEKEKKDIDKNSQATMSNMKMVIDRVAILESRILNKSVSKHPPALTVKRVIPLPLKR